MLSNHPNILGGNGGGVSSTVIGGIGLFANGTNAAPSISFQSDPDTGIYLDAANTLGIATAGVGTIIFSSSAGIGKIKAHGTRVLALEAGTGNTNITLTPSGTGTVVSTNVNFDVTSSLVTAEVYCTAAFAIGRGGSIALGGLVDGSNSSTFAAIAGQKESAVSGATGGYLGLFTRANGAAMTERARILSTGRFLLGTSTDSGALLQIGTNTTTSAGGMVFGTDTFLYRSSANALTTTGNLLIGGTTASTGVGTGALQVAGGIYAGQASVFGGDVTRSGTGESLFIATTSNTASSGRIRLANSGASGRTFDVLSGGSTAADATIQSKFAIYDVTAGAARMTIDSTGAATFAGAVAVTGALKLGNAYVAGAVVGTGYVTIQDSTGTTYRVPVLV